MTQQMLESLRQNWASLRLSSEKVAICQLVSDQNYWSWDDVVDDLIPETGNMSPPLIIVQDGRALEPYDFHAYKVEVNGNVLDFDESLQGVVVRQTGIQTRTEYPPYVTPFWDKCRMIHCGDILNFAVLTNVVKSEISESELRFTFFRDAIPSQYEDFLQKAIFLNAFLQGWLYTNLPHCRNEALHARYWLVATIDGLRKECRWVFPQQNRKRMRFPHSWRSQVLGGIKTWSEFLAAQPLLKMWINAVVTLDDFGEFAVIDRDRLSGEQKMIAFDMGVQAAKNTAENLTSADVTPRGKGVLPVDDTQDH